MSNSLGLILSSILHLACLCYIYVDYTYSTSISANKVTSIQIEIVEEKPLYKEIKTNSEKKIRHTKQITKKQIQLKKTDKPFKKKPLSPSFTKQANLSKTTIVPPRYKLGSLNNPLPIYPKKARRKGWEGLVILSAIVHNNGHIKTLNIKQSSGYALLDKSAHNTVKKWIFQPALSNTKKIEHPLDIPIRFKLSN